LIRLAPELLEQQLLRNQLHLEFNLKVKQLF